MGARPFDRSLMTPASAADMNRFSPKHKQNQPETGHRLNLRTPSSFVPKTVGPGNRGTSSALRDQSPSALARFESVRSPAFGNSMTENSPQGRYHRALANVRNDGEITSSMAVRGTRNSPINSMRPSAMNDGSENKTKINARESVNSCPRNTYDPAVGFAASNLTNDENRGVSTLLGNNENLRTTENNENRGSSYATSGTIGGQEIAFSSATNSIVNPESSSALCKPIGDRSRKSEMTDDEETIARNRQWEENSLLAEKMLNEALLPPSAIHAHDIIGSTLGQEGLSLIREKLTSKYSAKDEPVNLRGAAKSRELAVGEKKENGAKSKRADQLRRQGAFDKESDRNDVTSGVAVTDQDHVPNHYAENSPLGTNNLHEGFNILENIGTSQGLKIPEESCKENSSNDPRRAIMRGIWKNYAVRPDQSSANDITADQDENHSLKDTLGGPNSSHSSLIAPATGCQSLRAELSNYGPGNSNLIQSEELNNQIFPEQARVSSGIVQNPVNVDRLRGAMEEMSVNHSKVHNCHQCQEPIRTDDVVVTAEKARDSFWHPGCFVCSVCNELLADLVYFYYKDKLYCGRDLPTLLEIPRCFACDEVSHDFNFLLEYKNLTFIFPISDFFHCNYFLCKIT